MPKMHSTAEIRPDWELGAKIRELREDRQLTIRGAAAQIHVSDTTWKSMETGYGYTAASERIERRPAATTVVAAAQLLGANPHDWLHLAGLSDKIRVDGVSVDLAITNPATDVKVMLAKINALTDEQRVHVDAIVDAFAAQNEAQAAQARSKRRKG